MIGKLREGNFDNPKSDEERKRWGDRVRQIAKAAGTNYDMATVVGNIPNTEDAIKILKKIKEAVNRSGFAIYMDGFYDDDRPFDGIAGDFAKGRVDEWISTYVGISINDLNKSKKFFDSVEKILKSKR